MTPQRPTTHRTSPAHEDLFEVLRRWRLDPDVPARRLIDANRVVEQAKGALMLRYGIDSPQAFAVMVRWSRLTRTSVPVLAHTLMHGICERNPGTETRQRTLVRWLEDQLRDGDPDLGRPAPPPVWLRASA